jgi:hypothetical protein
LFLGAEFFRPIFLSRIKLNGKMHLFSVADGLFRVHIRLCPSTASLKCGNKFKEIK